jgi:chromosome segregation ATPase
MRHRVVAVLIAAGMLAGPALAQVSDHPHPQAQPLRDYLSEVEADKIRDAREPSERIKLYISFADDRLKKFDYEINRAAQERRRSDILNGLLNGYAGCVDDAADQIALAKEKHADIREALRIMQARIKEFLELLQKYDKDGPDLEMYRETLEDAIDGTKDAISDAQDAQKEMQPPPVRRKQ